MCLGKESLERKERKGRGAGVESIFMAQAFLLRFYIDW
jgi:hypothetical protein